MTVTNRVWDPSAGPGFVTWRTGSPDPTGLEYPGPGAFGSTSDYCVLRSTNQQPPLDPESLDTDGSPAGLWLFDGDLLDSSGNGRDLSVTAGAALYGPGPVPGSSALFCNGSSRFSVTNAAFAALGDVTIEAIIKPLTLATGQEFIATYAGPGETSIDNAHYSLRLVADNIASIFHEQGAGVNETADADSTGVVPIDQWSHLACVRDGLEDKLYLNGSPVLIIEALNDPTDGSNNAFVVGDFPAATGAFQGFVSSLRVYPGTVRTDAQLLAAARRALPLSVRP